MRTGGCARALRAIPAKRDLRVQHCTGAPGIVNTMAMLPAEPETDALLQAAGELTWAAGPDWPSCPASATALRAAATLSSSSTCAPARRSGSSERGCFAMHAIEQSRRAAGSQHGQRKFSLWTGDLGLACYLWDCIRVSAGFPTLDFF